MSQALRLLVEAPTHLLEALRNPCLVSYKNHQVKASRSVAHPLLDKVINSLSWNLALEALRLLVEAPTQLLEALRNPCLVSYKNH